MSDTISDGKDEERLAACFNCKKSKLKCVRSDRSATCTRCTQRQLQCAAPQFHVGRHKGVKNKHSGLEKAVLQIEQALRRSQPGTEQIQDAEQATELRYLLDRSRELLGTENGHQRQFSGANGSHRECSVTSPRHTSTSRGTPSSQVESRENGTPSREIDKDQLDLDDAENPLQLLARTSELLSSIRPPANSHGGYRIPAKSLSVRNLPVKNDDDGDLRKFFGRFQPRLDVGEDLDPVGLGLLSVAEAEALFLYFYEKLAHTRWGIDPVIHTVDFVRSRSPFLFTSIAAASALFLPSMESMYRRLSNHRKKIAGLVMAKRYKSVEIVLAFMVNIPWISAGEHWADDETSTYMSMALSIALDLSLNKIILPSSMESPFSRDSVAMSDRISARKALAVDGFGEVDPDSVLGRRLLRRRERTWLSLFVLERGVCLARGRNPVLPMSPLIENCDRWHMCDLADRWDGSIVSVAVLRRDLAKLITNLRVTCDSYANGVVEPTVVDRLKNEITMFFDRWYQTWPLQIGDREQLSLPPYVEILASHTRLSMYSSVINHSTAPVAARHFFRSAGLSSALNVLRVAVQGEGQLRSMPNNTAIMISFAACFALRVSTVADGRGSSLAPSIRGLISETIDVLERIGSAPVQRKGLSCLFAGQLREILKLASRSAEVTRSLPEPNGDEPEATVVFPGMNATQLATHHGPVQMHMPATTLPPDYLLFSTMSNDQLDEAINNTDVGLDAAWEDFQFQHASELDWMDWSTFA
ncbi:Uu.00g055730.m01.CDS01 [Anthostomella pinea]|uniref:Uu.00g055730.m01.CDS01 n=1 Tax=Anthostomella pinea TaxID=933095 RepID=A0AAI8YPQ2_9PEZI|nr:Uu.00g055730.m01.CDS01 [Anthostomella pinea]